MSDDILVAMHAAVNKTDKVPALGGLYFSVEK